jgi:SNF2 family DNA or RNA helicase
MPATLTKVGETLEVDLSTCARGTAEFGDTLTRIQEMKDGDNAPRFDWDRKIWVFMANPDVAERLVKGAGCKAGDDVIDWMREARVQQQADLATVLPDDVKGLIIPWAYKRADWQPQDVNGTPVVGLTPYQRVAVDHMVRHTRVLLGDEMGLGKTLIALSAVEEYKIKNGITGGPVLIVAPASVKGAWVREVKRWLPEGTPVASVNGATPAKRKAQLEEGIAANAYIICNWEQLRVKKEKVKGVVKRNDGSQYERWDTIQVAKEPLFSETEWLAVIADEVHRAKNPKSQQSQGLRLIQKALMKFGLTGTAVQNAPDELWAILAWLFPEDYHEDGKKGWQKHPERLNRLAYWPFYMLFCDFYEVNNRKMVVGVKNADQLRFRLKDRMVRRTASILGLKGRKRFYYPLDMGKYQRGLYDEATQSMWLQVEKDAAEGDKSAQRFIDTMLAGGNVYTIPNGAARMVRQQQILESPALLGGDDDSVVLDDLVEKVMDSRPDQWTIFVLYKGTCDLVKERLEAKGLTVGVYNGDVSPEERTVLEDAFQAGKLDAIVGTIGAMREGITLTAGYQQYWVSRPPVPAWAEQGEARNDRMGQTERVNVWIPQPRNTVADGNIRILNKRKESIVKKIQPMDHIETEEAA